MICFAIKYEFSENLSGILLTQGWTDLVLHNRVLNVLVYELIL